MAVQPDRVAAHTPDDINAKIRQRMEERVAQLAAADPAFLDERLEALDREWDIERFLETSTAGLGLLGLVLGVTRRRAWLLLPGIACACLLQQSLRGWCPQAPLLRRLGVRTRREIDTERYALKVLRGDFRELPSALNENVRADVEAVLHAVRC